MKNLFVIVLIVLLSNCYQLHSKLPPGWKQLDMHTFSIDVPVQWEADTATDQEDSFIERIVGPDLILNFDCSNMGYAHHLSEDPEQVKTCYLHTDSNIAYRYITIWPKETGKGMTGVYINSRNSSANFQMNGSNLSAKNQLLALRAFKTIVLK